MATKAIETELMDLENQFWRATKEKDSETAMSLTDDTCILTGPQGVSIHDRKEFEKIFADTSWTLDDYEIKDNPEVLLIKDDVAVIAYKVHEKMTVEGKPVTIEASDASTWVRRGGRWVCALHTEAITGDPFGRDRMPAS
jgi:ketosteroid isomerase-like protein